MGILGRPSAIWLWRPYSPPPRKTSPSPPICRGQYNVKWRRRSGWQCPAARAGLTTARGPNHPDRTSFNLPAISMPYIYIVLSISRLSHSRALYIVLLRWNPSPSSSLLLLPLFMSHLHHRPMQSSPHSNTVDFSISDSLDTIKHEYQSLHSELIKVRSERDELELKRASSSSLLSTQTQFTPPFQSSLNYQNWVQYEGPFSISKLNMNVLIPTTKKK